MLLALTVVLILMLVSGMPISFALGISGLASLLTGDAGISPWLFFPQRAFRAMDSFPLLAIPFFVLAGELMGISITAKLVDFARSLVGRIRGGLAYVTVLACMFFGGVTGVGVAETVAIGSILILSMVDEGYDKGFAAAVVAAASTLGPIIPPSVPMIIYALSVGGNISVKDLFLGGAIPGVVLGLGFMVSAAIISRRRGFPIAEEPFSLRNVWAALKKALWALLMPVIIVGGIVSGIFTATEASVVAVIYALFVGFLINKDLKWSHLPKFLVRAGVVSSVVLILMAMASIVAWIITINNVPHMLAQVLFSLTTSPTMIILITILLLLIVGCFIDSAAAIIMFAPLLSAVAAEFGIDPIHYGIVVVMTLMIGMITPPVGVILFVASSVAQERFETVVKNVVLFIAAAVVVLVVIAFFPSLVLVLPRLTGY